MPDYAQASSLNWALTHTLRFGENDIFPRSFEFDAYKSQWPEVLAHLKAVDLSKHEVGCAIKLLVPKGRWSFRVGTQLDPFDHLLFLAMVHEIAPSIEEFRVAPEKKVACAYRVASDSKGALFDRNGWLNFHERSEELCSEKQCRYVACADISDFYNQTSHHRIHNALASANVNEERADSIENFLSNLNSRHHSRGLPVGPSASILLAEGCMADVDNFLIRRGYNHTRYVDDFRIFCVSRQQATSSLHDLAEYLYTAHRLSLQSNKTRILTKENFRNEDLVDPEALEIQSKKQKISDLIASIELSPYETEDEAFELDDSTKAELLRETLDDLFRSLFDQPGLHIGLARYLLRRASTLRTRVIMSQVLDNIEFLLPVLNDVIKYLVHSYDKNSPDQVGEVLQFLATRSTFSQVPYVQQQVLAAFTAVPAFCDGYRAITISEGSNSQIRDRFTALIAKQYKQVDWLRGKKETWQNSTPFGQRATIWAAPILPRNERVHWLKSISNYPVLSVSSVAKAVLAGIGSLK